MAKTATELQLDRIESDVCDIKEAVYGNGTIGLKMKVDRIEQRNKLTGTLGMIAIAAIVTSILQIWG